MTRSCLVSYVAHTHMHTHTPSLLTVLQSMTRMGSFMESLGISTDDVWSLFLLLDADENGVIDLDEFVNGCMNLHGPAKSLQAGRRPSGARKGLVVKVGTLALVGATCFRCHIAHAF